MSDTHNREEEISAETYATVMRHQFILESLRDRLQKIEDATTIMKDKWRRGYESTRDFTIYVGSTSAEKRWKLVSQLVPAFKITSPNHLQSLAK